MVEYQARTRTSYLVVVGLLGAIGIISAAVLVWLFQRPGLRDQERATLVVMCGLGCAVPIGYWFGSAAYRIGGGRNLIRIHDDRIEVPAAASRRPLVFPREGTKIQIRAVRVQVGGVGDVARGHLITFTRGAQKRELSTLVLAEDDRQLLLDDLARFQRGEPATGRVAAAASPRTAYDDRLDRELADL